MSKPPRESKQKGQNLNISLRIYIIPKQQTLMSNNVFLHLSNKNNNLLTKAKSYLQLKVVSRLKWNLFLLSNKLKNTKSHPDMRSKKTKDLSL